MSAAIEFIDAAAVGRLLDPARAVQAIRRALGSGYRTETDHLRLAEPLQNGEFLLMPSETGEAVGVKVLTVAPHNAAHGSPRIQGLYLLFDRRTLAPRCIVDGASLTGLRTAAVSLAAVQDRLLASQAPLDVVVYGTGPQGLAHVRTLRALLEGRRPIRSVTAIVRDPERSAGDSAVGAAAFTRILRSATPEARRATAEAGLIVCATTARTPLFDGALVRDDAALIAVGSHEPHARELDARLLERSEVVVEGVAAALRECGDVVMAIEEGLLDASGLLPMERLIRGEAHARDDRPMVFKSCGMPWEDLVIASAIVEARDAARDAARGPARGPAGNAGGA